MLFIIILVSIHHILEMEHVATKENLIQAEHMPTMKVKLFQAGEVKSEIISVFLSVFYLVLVVRFFQSWSDVTTITASLRDIGVLLLIAALMESIIFIKVVLTNHKQ